MAPSTVSFRVIFLQRLLPLTLPLTLHFPAAAPLQFPAWDRQLFVTYKGLGETGYYTDWNHLTQNFLISNYESSQAIDKCVGLAGFPFEEA